MDGNNSMETLCRICLEDGASIPIFETDNKENNIHFKLSTCFSEKIEDVKGYPRNICESCNNTLETVCNFISRYKETCKILENGVLIVKKENYSDYSYNEHSEVEIEISEIKTEPIDINEHLNTTDHLIEIEKPLKLKCEVVKRPIKRERRTTSIKSSIKNNTSKIASSILEGDFLWTGEKWCLKSRKPTIPAKSEQVKTVKQKEIKIKKVKGTKPIPPKLCDVCGEVFKTQDKLSVHKRNVHFKKPVKCPKCPRVCCSIYYLNRHIKRKHENIKNFVCTACGARFTFKGELTSHFRNVHDKNLKPKKVFACKLCDKTYKCAKSVLVHERSVHTGQRPAVCSVCGTSFYHEDYLKEHMRLHTGETPFKCPVCGRGYAQRCNMKSHLRIHRISELDAATLSKIKPNYLKLLKV